jgi:hypothetical protein
MRRGGVLDRAREFLWAHARLLERRLYERAFEDGSADAVVAAVRAYRNPDGGLGHALEPDLRAPTSQPIHVDAGLSALEEAGARDPDLVAGVCDFLARVAPSSGAIPYALPDAMEHARADHWNGGYALAPSLHATAGVLARLHAHGARHEWLDRATEWCFLEVSGRPPYTGHRLLNVLEFLRRAPDRARADRLWPHVTARLFEADHVMLETPVTSYGLVPLRFAPTPDHPARPLFADDVIERHLEHLLDQQRSDGGWPLFWEPPGPAAVAEWRGRWTLDALRVLRAYGRI